MSKKAIAVTTALLASWFIVIMTFTQKLEGLLTYSPFTLMGVLGAIFANSTGAGGGVVFIPFFEQLDIQAHQSVATSFAIQCFGMTAGSIVWLSFFRKGAQRPQYWSLKKSLLLWAALPSVMGLWFCYGLDIKPPGSFSVAFAVFSVVLGSLLLVTMRRKKQLQETLEIEQRELYAIGCLSFVGGIVTAWLSVGVGELLALYLIFRRFNIALAVAVAVVVSAITVWSGIYYHAVVSDAVVWPIVLFAGPGAIVGGVFARKLALWLPPVKLKGFFAVWVILMGVGNLVL